MKILKKPPCFYGEKYQNDQINKHRNRYSNHWKHRINLLKYLIKKHYEPRILIKNKEKIVAVDIGCSIGTMAIEASKMGYDSFGIDFDSQAIRIANELAEEEKANVKFIQGDIANWNQKLPAIDIAICFDIFEHLHDDEIGSFLQTIKEQLSEDGSIVFHTFPTEFDHIFYTNIITSIPLMLFFFLPSNIFNRIVKIYSCIIDSLLILVAGKKYKEIIASIEHCNPTTVKRLENIFKRSGYKVLYLDSSNLYPFKKWTQWIFSRHSIADRNIYGVAAPVK
ncbi:MAG: class I SAM-dependent methyltransferase [Patescibacteria group bacterium]